MVLLLENAVLFQVKLEPDLNTTTFSMQNAYYFARMSKMVYLPQGEVEGLLKGNETAAGMGFNHFYWFEVR